MDIQLNYTYGGDKVSAVLSFIIGALMFMTPLLTLYFAFTKLNKVEEPNFKAKYGSLYEGLKTDSKIHLLCNFIFTCRRAILIVMTVFLSDYPAI
jgi:divalent metal cation (Fe/Co/Zn/Cd) transporter